MKTPSILLVALAATSATAATPENNPPDQVKLEQMAGRFAPTEITADISKLSPNEHKILAKLVEASQIIDGLFLRQIWPENRRCC